MQRVVYLLLFFTITSLAQTTTDTGTLKNYASFYTQQPTKVLVVGTFHFDYPGLDEVKTAENDKIDVLTEPKKSEVTELVNYIKRFKPTKIAIEAFPNWKSNEKLKKYKQGDFQKERDERFQLGMRIAKELEIDSVYPVDAGSLKAELWKKDSLLIKNLIKDIDWEAEDSFWNDAEKAFAYEDEITKNYSLLNIFKRMNSRQGHNFNYGLYLTGAFETGDGQGADNLAMWWYNRNLRIFQKIQKITNDPDDRVLVIIGNGHASILRQLYEASPEFEFIEFDSLEH